MSGKPTEDDIYANIEKIKDEVYEVREQINSATCQQCAQCYQKLLLLETQLKGWQRELDKLRSNG